MMNATRYAAKAPAPAVSENASPKDSVSLGSLADNTAVRATAWLVGSSAAGGFLGSQLANLTGVGSHLAGSVLGATGGVIPGFIAGSMIGAISDGDRGWGGLGGGMIGGAAGGVLGGIAGGVLGSGAIGSTLGAVAGVLGGAAGGFIMHLRTDPGN